MTKWPMHPLGGLGEIVTGSTPLTSRDEYFGGNIPFATPAELDASQPILHTPRTLSELGASTVRMIPKDAILVCCIGSLGKIGMAGQRLATNQQINSIIFDQAKVWPRFGLHACRQLRPRLEAMAPATTVAIVSKSKFAALEIPLPPLADQKRIAAILDQADELRRKQRAALEAAERFPLALFNQRFGDPLRSDPRAPVSSLGDVCLVIRDGTHKTPNYVELGIPFVTVKNIVGGMLNLRDTKRISVDEHRELTRRIRPERGDVLVSKDGTIGVPCLVRTDEEFSIFVSVALIRADKEKIDPTFLTCQFRTDWVQKQIQESSKGIAIRHLHLEDFRRLKILLPPLTEQQSFATFIERHGSFVDLHHAREAAVNALFWSLQHRAFRGELTSKQAERELEMAS